MTNKTKDEKGISWQNLDKDGKLIQANSKTYDGEHYWYNAQTASTGWRGANVSPEMKKIAGETIRDNSVQRYKKKK